MAKNFEILKENSTLLLSEDGLIFRDLNKNGKLDVYEDPRQPIPERVEDLLSQMTLEEKAGSMFINGTGVNEDASIEPKIDPNEAMWLMSAKAQMEVHQMNHFNIWDIPGAVILARWVNNLQQFAESTRLGIPISIASDPRNHFSRAIYEMQAEDYSQWCQPLGLAAIGDEAFVRQFADIVRQEYLATGIRMALHPQIDLATEPRWPRINGTFGADAYLSARMAKAYIRGFQGDALGPESVACMTKHFPGGGPQKEGLDPHFPFQKGQVYPGNNFDYHLIPFEAAFEANTAAIMPYYGVPMDQTDENVAMSYNKAIITGLLRQKYGFDRVVCTDWGLVTDLVTPKFTWPARAWGVEHLSEVERVRKIIEAGVDQFGGESCPVYVIQLVRQGDISEARIDQSVRRILTLKFRLGLFDNPFVDLDQTSKVIGNPQSLAAGLTAQSKAMTLLKNNEQVLPLRTGFKVYVKNLDPDLASQYAEVVQTPQEADLILLRLSTPWVPVETDIPFAQGFHHGDLDFKGEEKAAILALLETKPTIVVIELDRPVVFPEINAAAMAVLADFGATDKAVLDVIFGKIAPQGRLPFELPSSMEAVRKQRSDLPFDSDNPLYPFGFGLSYAGQALRMN
ncbi:MAG: glycoside hydrolase family 3 protein [Anaerolineales bacterium]